MNYSDKTAVVRLQNSADWPDTEMDGARAAGHSLTNDGCFVGNLLVVGLVDRVG